MNEEFEPKKKDNVMEEREDNQDRNKISEQVNAKLNEEKSFEENKSTKRHIGRIISRIIWTIISIFIIFEVVMGILNMQRINDDKEPIWCFDKKTEKGKNKETKTCHLGLYVIVKTKEGTETKTTLAPFFLQ